MSQENKRVKLGRIQQEISVVISGIVQIENDEAELREAKETLLVKFESLQKKEAKLIVKVKPV